MAKTVYLLLTRSNTFVSQAIHQITHSTYTHISLSLDEHLAIMYSFCRLYPRLAVPAGFSTESIDHGFYDLHPQIPCALYALTVADSDYQRLQMALILLYDRRRELHYDLLGTFLCTFNRAHERYNRRYCSWFVAELLGRLGILSFDRHYSLIKPMDFTNRDELRLVYQGTVGHLAEKIHSATFEAV